MNIKLKIILQLKINKLYLKHNNVKINYYLKVKLLLSFFFLCELMVTIE